MILIWYPQAAEWLEGVLQISYYRLAQLVLLRYSGLVILGAVSKKKNFTHQGALSCVPWFCNTEVIKYTKWCVLIRFRSCFGFSVVIWVRFFLFVYVQICWCLKLCLVLCACLCALSFCDVWLLWGSFPRGKSTVCVWLNASLSVFFIFNYH